DLDWERDWAALGERAWSVLQERRMRDIRPHDPFAEFERYYSLLRRSNKNYLSEVFVGIDPRSGQPLFVPKRVFEGHGYIIGGSDSGKTSHAIAQLLIQLADPYIDRAGQDVGPPPILIIDLKPEGDRF